MRAFQGGTDGASTNLMVRADADGKSGQIELEIENQTPRRVVVRVQDAYTGEHRRLALKSGQSLDLKWSAAAVQGWYDLVITVEGDSSFKYQLAGHFETGHDSISDPAMGGLSIEN
ncbi:MAG TPA: phospholipase domain-containing protein [Verrucomicrobiae bacterium]|nr:phospholipase domain-containing protein [Verrucomicrobiae bacterium]